MHYPCLTSRSPDPILADHFKWQTAVENKAWNIFILHFAYCLLLYQIAIFRGAEEKARRAMFAKVRALRTLQERTRSSPPRRNLLVCSPGSTPKNKSAGMRGSRAQSEREREQQ